MPDKKEIWQEAFDDYCRNEFGGREPSGREFDEASAYADEQLAEWEAENADRIDNRFDEDEI